MYPVESEGSMHSPQLTENLSLLHHEAETLHIGGWPKLLP